MQRSTSFRVPALMTVGLSLSFALGCTPGETAGTGSGGSKQTGSGGSGQTGSGGASTTGSGGASTTGSGGNNTTGSGGASTTGSGGNNTTGSGGNNTTGSGGNNTTGSGGNNTTGSGGNNTTGSGGNGTGSGGSSTGSGGSGTGTGGAGGGSNCSAGANIISDFESATAVTLNPKGGVWGTYKGMGTITPAPVAGSTTPTGVATAADGAGTCKNALHIVASGATDYSGFAATLAPAPKTGMLSFANPVDVSTHKGISFKIRSGSGTPPTVYFDLKTKESTPMAEGGSLSDATSNNPDTAIGLRNNRGQVLAPPWIPSALSSTYQTVNIPFSMLYPRWVPAPGSSNACPAPGAGVAPCQAPKFNPKNVLGIEFSMVNDPGYPKPSGSTVGTYDLWIDDVAWIDDDMGVQTMTGFPLTGAGAVGMCTKPTGADGKYLVSAYKQWKATFLKSNGAVVRPENANDVVSEGIAYGMLIAANFNDKATFDSLYSFWKSNKGAGSSTAGLMTWCLGSMGGGMGSACNAQGGGSATDADEDAAYALLQAGKIFGQASYTDDAKGLIGDIWAKDIDTTSNLPTGGSNYSNSTSSKVTNPSYFAPSYYRAFAAVDSGHAWGAVADKSIAVINSLGGTNGLVPAWCGSNCTAAGSNGAATDTIYQYDSHRTPMRVALDYCFNGTVAAKTYTDKTTNFFATSAFAAKDGVGRMVDLYQLNGMPATSGTAPNSASIIGTAAVGAMASASGGGANKQFLDDAYQAVFDMATRGTLATVDPSMKTPYSYYNATVGLLTLLIMTGNFSH